MPDRHDETIAFAHDGNILLRCRRCRTDEKVPTYYTLPEIADALRAFHRAHLRRCKPRPAPAPDMVLE